MFGRKQLQTRLFFATDIHGSEQCFRKWLNAARVYEPAALLLGGDVTGKVIVPLVSTGNGGWRGEIFGRAVEAHSSEELAALQKQIRNRGHYDLLLSVDEKAALDSDPAQLDATFERVVREGLERWVALAEERLGESGVPCFVMLGNDDFPELVQALQGSKVLHYAEDQMYELPGGFELISLGYSTPTPWHTAREIPEEEMADKIDRLASRLVSPERAVFNLHCPPRDTHLDQAPVLDETLRPVVGAGGMLVGSVGSTAVRKAIERYQPLLGLHGHVHESAGVEKLGRTLCINPGSDYGDGVLRGAIVELDSNKGVKRWQLLQA
jgi:Icc-related predicted phosphoesterase